MHAELMVKQIIDAGGTPTVVCGCGHRVSFLDKNIKTVLQEYLSRCPACGQFRRLIDSKTEE